MRTSSPFLVTIPRSQIGGVGDVRLVYPRIVDPMVSDLRAASALRPASPDRLLDALYLLAESNRVVLKREAGWALRRGGSRRARRPHVLMGPEHAVRVPPLLDPL